MFGPGEWTTANPNPPSVLFFPFDPTTGAGGAYLYVAQGPSEIGIPTVAPQVITHEGFGANLFLAYDYVHATAPPTASSFFDVFFQVPTDNNMDYLVRVTATGFTAYEKPDGVVAPTPGGNFDPTMAPWTPLSQADLDLARFQAAIGFGTSPSPDGGDVPHQIAEFQVSISSPGTENPPGVYSPDPAFWSASDAPLGSAIFTLNPNGSTTVTPALGPNGDPVLQPQDLVPEPSSVLLAVVGSLCLLSYRAMARAAA